MLPFQYDVIYKAKNKLMSASEANIHCSGIWSILAACCTSITVTKAGVTHKWSTFFDLFYSMSGASLCTKINNLLIYQNLTFFKIIYKFIVCFLFNAPPVINPFPNVTNNILHVKFILVKSVHLKEIFLKIDRIWIRLELKLI